MAEIISPNFATWPWCHWSDICETGIGLRDGDNLWSWGEIEQQVNRYATGLSQQGIERGDVVVGIGDNQIALIWLQLACLRVGACFVTINPKTPKKQIHQLVTRISANYMWFAKGVETLSGTWQQIQLIDAVYEPIATTWQPHRLATLTYTSGSSGEPKAVAHSANNHLYSAAGLLSWLTFEFCDSWLLSLPLFHVSGLAIVWRWLLSGGVLVMPTNKGFIHDLSTVTHASLVPTQLQRMLDHSTIDQLALKRVLLGGSAIPSELTNRAAQKGIECWVGYGMTEMSSTVTAKRADGQAGVGHVLPYRAMRIENDEILVKGESLALGYYRYGAIDRAHDVTGWFATKDLGFVENTELHIKGRLDNMFISGGENIHPEKIEQALQLYPQIEQAIVIGIEDQEFGHRPLAVIVSDENIDHTDLHRFLSDKLTKFEYPVRYEAMPNELFNHGIKISRQQVKAWFSYLSSL